MPQDAIFTGLQRVNCRGETVVFLILLTRQVIKETWQIWHRLTGERGTGLSEQNSKSFRPRRDVHLVGSQKSWKSFFLPSFNVECVVFLFMHISSPSEFRESYSHEKIFWVETSFCTAWLPYMRGVVIHLLTKIMPCSGNGQSLPVPF